MDFMINLILLEFLSLLEYLLILKYVFNLEKILINLIKLAQWLINSIFSKNLSVIHKNLRSLLKGSYRVSTLSWLICLYQPIAMEIKAKKTKILRNI